MEMNIQVVEKFLGEVRDVWFSSFDDAFCWVGCHIDMSKIEESEYEAKVFVDGKEIGNAKY